MKKIKTVMADESNIIMPALGIGVLTALLGGMNKMFGLNEEKTPQKLAEEMMAGAIRGILDHFEYKIDELKRDIDRKSEEIGKLKEQLESKKNQKKDETKRI